MTGQHEYDAIADRYRESKWLLFRHYIERYTLFEVLGRTAGPDGGGAGVRRRGLHPPVQAGGRGGGNRC